MSKRAANERLKLCIVISYDKYVRFFAMRRREVFGKFLFGDLMFIGVRQFTFPTRDLEEDASPTTAVGANRGPRVFALLLLLQEQRHER